MVTKEQLLSIIPDLPHQFSMDELLQKLYPFEEAWRKEWLATSERFLPGMKVSGRVIHKAPFGDFIEIGASEPALLEIICLPALTPQQYGAGDYNPLGSTVTAWVLGLPGERTKQLRLTQDTSTDFDAIKARTFQDK